MNQFIRCLLYFIVPMALMSCTTESTLGPADIKEIGLNMSIDEVRAKLGEPDNKIRFKTVHSWEYKFGDGFGVVSFDGEEKVKAVALDGKFIQHVDMEK